MRYIRLQTIDGDIVLVAAHKIVYLLETSETYESEPKVLTVRNFTFVALSDNLFIKVKETIDTIAKEILDA